MCMHILLYAAAICNFNDQWLSEPENFWHSWYNFNLSHFPSLPFTLKASALNIDNLLDFFQFGCSHYLLKLTPTWMICSAAMSCIRRRTSQCLMSNVISQVLCSRSRQMSKQMVGRRRMKGRSHGNYAISPQRAIMALCAATSFLRSVWRQSQWREWRDRDMNCFSQRDFRISKLQNENHNVCFCLGFPNTVMEKIRVIEWQKHCILSRYRPHACSGWGHISEKSQICTWLRTTYENGANPFQIRFDLICCCSHFH